jgi:hypothetical protein
MKQHFGVRPGPCTLTLLLALTSSAAAVEAPPGVGWHVVRPGDTLEGITGHYLGDSARWRENHALNPELANPHLLLPGQRLQVLLSGVLPPANAQLLSTGPRVEAQPLPFSWRHAQSRDLLRQRDGVKTGTDASSELLFGDGTRLRLNEDSLLFLSGSSAGDQRPAVDDTVEILLGEADLRRAAPASREVEIVVGGARAVPHGARAEARARRPTTGQGAHFMVFQGAGSLSAGGAEVELAQGTGSVVPAAGPPSPPEALLAAPELVDPPAGGHVAAASAVFSWQPVAGAASYTVELCADGDCMELVRRESGVGQPSWRPPVAPGSMHWRVTAVASSGLDGYPSAARAVEVVSATAPREPLAVTPTGNVVGFGDGFILGPGARLEVAAAPGRAVEYRLDDAVVPVETWSGAWEPGTHVAAAFLPGDGAANEAPLRFVYDPQPPVLQWQVGDPALLEGHGLDQDVQRRRPPRHTLPERSAEVPVLWSPDGRRWLPVLAASAEADAEGLLADWVVASDRPQVFLWALADGAFGAGSPVAPAALELVRVWAADELSAVRDLRLRVRPAERGFALELQATDLVGNSTAVTWLLVRR